ncbi:flagellar basal body P-ring formation chaperone FlgA [Halomonas sp. M20]|uniref:flagellar basal body P-ring formation chaperone FlgA n=1 Tax=Halomonas sp. M20 TaxID=2763264 RepID=UPI001D0AF0CA|nr:flagellar basal body P-ring formation chaperone FlgA [Halomonas sp. M20]
MFESTLKTLGSLLCWCSILLATAAGAISFEEQDGNSVLEQRVRDFLEWEAQDLGRDIKVTPHSGSARLSNCHDPEPFLTNPEQRLYGRVSVGIRCESGQTRYLQADVSVLVDHVIVARDIEAGATIGAGDVELVEGRLEKLPRHALLELSEALGMSATRPLRTGALLQSHHLRKQRLVNRGSRVTVIAKGNGFSVRREAKALDNGSLGDAVRLNIADGGQLKAIVTGHGRLEVVF